MPATYDPSLPTDRDWVRHLLRDTDISSAQLSDAEIDAVISEQTAGGAALKYFAAAACLSSLAQSWAVAGQGVESIGIGRLHITEGSSSSGVSAVEDYICWLKSEGQRRMIRGGRRFAVNLN